MTNQFPKIESAGLNAWLIRLFAEISDTNIAPIMSLAQKCKCVFNTALIDLTPSYTTLLVEFDVLQITPNQAHLKLQTILTELSLTESAPPTSSMTGPIKELPVWYDTRVGPDLMHVAYEKSISCEQLIELHSNTIYTVFALGFAPGFAFMGSLAAHLEVPRKTTPRQQVYPGSVAIAGRQTAAYPTYSPGGWNIIGRTPITLFDRNRKHMSYFQIGDRVQMVPIDQHSFLNLGGNPTPQKDR